MSDTSSSSFNELKDNESTAPSTSIPINTSLLHADKPLPTTVAKPASVKNATLSSDYSTLFIPAPHPAFTVDWFTHYLKQTRVLVILALLIFTLVLVIWIASLGKAGVIGAPNGSGSVTCASWVGDLVPDVVSTCPPQRAEIYYAGSASSGGVRLEEQTLPYADVAVQPLAIYVPGAPASYYYTALFLDPDSPTRTSPSFRSNLRGVVTNLRLGETIDTNGGTWLMQYEGPNAADTRNHRYVWLVYRHSQPTSGLELPASSNLFVVEDWFASSWSQRPTLVAAAWFEARSNQ